MIFYGCILLTFSIIDVNRCTAMARSTNEADKSVALLQQHLCRDECSKKVCKIYKTTSIVYHLYQWTFCSYLLSHCSYICVPCVLHLMAHSLCERRTPWNSYGIDFAIFSRPFFYFARSDFFLIIFGAEGRARQLSTSKTRLHNMLDRCFCCCTPWNVEHIA